MSCDSVYDERNALVAALSKLFPASLEEHRPASPDEEWAPEWLWVVVIDLPTGQASWHIHERELESFDHLPRNAGREWDGHTTEEKYERLAALPLVRFTRMDVQELRAFDAPGLEPWATLRDTLIRRARIYRALAARLEVLLPPERECAVRESNPEPAG